MLTITLPDPTARQVSGSDPDGKPILSVVTKRTYGLATGRLAVAAEQLPLIGDPVVDPEEPSRLLADTDLFPYKFMTDLIVLGHAYGQGRSRFEASIGVGGATRKRILVIGDRLCASTGSGDILFSPPDKIDRIPLSYSHAYGGEDAAALRRFGHPLAEVAERLSAHEHDPSSTNPYSYARNPSGRGYLIEASVEAVNELRLPNLEDPADPLSPDRIALRHPLNWAQMPLPQATEWLNYDWFPRIGYFGIVPPFHTLPGGRAVAEIECGSAPSLSTPRIPTAEDAFRLLNGASLGLQFPHFRGGETISLENMHPAHSKLNFQLPIDVPKIWVDGRKGTLKATEPVIHTVVVEPDLDRVSILWRGSAPALRPYLPAELEKMPFKVEWTS